MLAGIDTHKDSLAVAVIDDLGTPLAAVQVANTETGFDELEALLARHEVRRVGIEGSANYGRGAAVRLAVTGRVQVVEVPPNLTSAERKAKPGQGKTDPIDALAIARIVAREADLPPVRLPVGPAADLRALADYRGQLVAEQTRLANRVHAELSGLRPGYQDLLPASLGPAFLAQARALVEQDRSVRARLLRARLDRMVALRAEIGQLNAQIRPRVAVLGGQLCELYGVGPLVAATIVGQVVDIRRYRSRHAFARANGTAPIPASSGRTDRYRLNRHGNRQLNRALYTMAITQIRGQTEGRAYYDRKRAEGKTGREALRCLKRRLSDVVYRTLLTEPGPSARTT